MTTVTAQFPDGQSPFPHQDSPGDGPGQDSGGLAYLPAGGVTAPGQRGNTSLITRQELAAEISAHALEGGEDASL
jgi:hypothetical protein